MEKQVYCIDIDGTICTTKGADYSKARPIAYRITMVNKLYKKNIINFYTARGSTTGADWREVTEKQLKKWGVKYHSLMFGKPFADYFIDDKGIQASTFFNRLFADHLKPNPYAGRLRSLHLHEEIYGPKGMIPGGAM